MHDFFTRIITTNVLGPNMVTSSNGGDFIVAYECGSCGEEHDDEDDASSCCPPKEIFRCAVCRKRHSSEESAVDCHPGAEHAQPMQCPVCLKRAETFEDAADCCLPSHPTMTSFGRQRVAEAVASGTSWIDAVLANLTH